MNERIKWIISGALLLLAVVMVGRALWGGPDLDELAASDDAKDRLQAVLIIQESQSNSPQLLGRLAADPVPSVSMQAITVMGQNQTTDYRQALKKIISERGDPKSRGAAAAALGHYEETSVREFTALLGRSEHPEVRAGAAKGLARMAQRDRKSAAPALIAGLRDHDPQVRIWAITGIYNISGHQFPGYNAAIAPNEQAGVIRFIETELREKGLAW